MTTTTTDLAADIDKLKGDLEALRRDVASIARGIKDLGAARSNEALEEISERARASLAAAEELVGRELEERPIASLLTAFGIGFLIGKLLDSGR